MDQIKAVWRQCDAVCLDVDSTVLMEEGFDELARFLGKGEEIARLTLQAMGGQMSFRDSLINRLNILKPSKADVQRFIDRDELSFTPGVQELVKKLQSLNVDVYLVSGGFRSLIMPLAQKLDIAGDHVFANKLIYNDDGSYCGFDVDQPTSASGGKPKVAQILKDSKGYKQLVFIGDGVTDAEASPPADAFIGFGGNIVRESVLKSTKWFVYDFKDLIAELEHHRSLSN